MLNTETEWSNFASLSKIQWKQLFAGRASLFSVDIENPGKFNTFIL